MKNYRRTAAAGLLYSMLKEIGSRRHKGDVQCRTASRRPWSVEELEACFVARDHNGQA
jgi:hypothetical protein